MSDESFAALESLVSEESALASALAAENERLRELLAQHTAQPTLTLTPSTEEGPSPAELAAELAASRSAQAEMARELAALKAAQHSAAAVQLAAEDQSDELALLRQSLATLASELQSEKERVSAIEEARKSESDKVTTLRNKVEESRRALMRLQAESASNRRSSVDWNTQGPPSSRRLSVNYNDTTPRRKSSLGLAPIAVGLGLSAEQQRSELSPLSTSPSGSGQTGKASPLSRLTHRRGSASLSVMESSGEEDRTNRLRDLRLGQHTLKIHSRRSSAVDNGGDLLSPDENEPERRRIPSFSFPSGSGGYHAHRHHSISEESESSQLSGPPSAPLRDMGRKHSVAVFESWSRRSSTASDMSSFGQGYVGFGAPGMMRRLSVGSATSESDAGYASMESAAENSALKVELHGLRIQLKEAEEGRRASDLCLQALKEYITQGSDGTLSLPPLPSDPEPKEEPAASTSRWSIPSLAGALGRKPSAIPSPSLLSLPGATTGKGSPNLTTFTSSANSRRASVSSNASTSTFADAKQTPNAGSAAPAIFGGFSFSALVSRGPQDHLVSGDASPTAPNDGFPTEPSPLMPEHEDVDESDFAPSTAPSLVSQSDSEESSRSSSPAEGSETGSPKMISTGPIEIEVYDESTPVSLVLNESGELVPKQHQEQTTPRLAYGMAC